MFRPGLKLRFWWNHTNRALRLDPFAPFSSFFVFLPKLLHILKIVQAPSGGGRGQFQNSKKFGPRVQPLSSFFIFSCKSGPTVQPLGCFPWFLWPSWYFFMMCYNIRWNGQPNCICFTTLCNLWAEGRTFYRNCRIWFYNMLNGLPACSILPKGCNLSAVGRT